MDISIVPNPPKDSLQKNKNRKSKKKRAKVKAIRQDGPEIKDQMDNKSEASDEIRSCNAGNGESENILLEKDVSVAPLAEQDKVDASTENASKEAKATKKKKRRTKNKKGVNVISEEIQSMVHKEMYTGTTENLAEIEDQMDNKSEASDEIRSCNVGNGESENILLDKDVSVAPLAEQDKLDASTENASKEAKATKKRKRRTKNKKGVNVINEEIQSMVQKEMYTGTTENLAEIKDQTHDNLENSEDISIHPLVEHPKLGVGSTDDATGGIINTEKRKKRKKKKVSVINEVQSMDQMDTDTRTSEKPDNGSNEVQNETVVDKGKGSADSILSSTSLEVSMHSSDVKEEKCLSEGLGQCPRIAVAIPFRRKLLVLDVNGLLAHIIMPAPKDCKADAHILRRAIFRRPFCDDFLRFCFQNFDVGIWSSRSKGIIDRVVDYLLGNQTRKLIFCWDMSHATQTGFRTLENIHKPLVFKELRKIWENDGPNLRWKKGDYDESNTLLLDDSPYKALLNPLHTAIFPSSFSYEDKNDNSLGPGGDLRVYLEGLLASDHVQKYVEQNPFGQGAINETNVSWEFYSRVLQSMTNQLESNYPSSSDITFSQEISAPITN